MSKDQGSATIETKGQAIKATPSTGSGNNGMQAAADVETAQGFRGFEVDPTPNAHYTVAGVIAGKPTPETHIDAAVAAREATGIAGTSGLEAAQMEKAAAAKVKKENK